MQGEEVALYKTTRSSIPRQQIDVAGEHRLKSQRLMYRAGSRPEKTFTLPSYAASVAEGLIAL